jgi:hypothetical protein
MGHQQGIIGPVKKPQRKLVVLSSLVGILTLTSALLLALAPPPLSGLADAKVAAYDNLWAAETPDNSGNLVDTLFQTRVPARLERWTSIYIHHSGAPYGSAAALGDHFVIGNGHGSPDGQIQMTQRWNNQLSAGAPRGAASIDPACISICLIGDFNSSAPTATQQRRAAELVSALQSQLSIGGDKVFILDSSPTPAGIGRLFPIAQLRAQILP